MLRSRHLAFGEHRYPILVPNATGARDKYPDRFALSHVVDPREGTT